MADVKQYPPRQCTFSITLNYRDVANLIRQGSSLAEVLSFLTTEELNELINNLDTERSFRENERK